MPDKEYKIRIVTAADASGLKETHEGLQEVHHGFVHAGSGAKEFHQLLHRITEQSPEFGTALKLLISPIGGALTLGILGARGMDESLKKLESSLVVTQWENYSSVIEATKKAFYDSQIEAAQFASELDHVRASAQSASEQVDHLANVHKAQQSAAEKIADAQEKLEMAKAATIQDPVARAEKELEIQNRFAVAAERRAQAVERLAKAEDHRKLANEELTATRLESELGRARGSAMGVKPEAAIDEQIRIEEGRLAAAHADAEKRKEQLEEVDKHPFDPTQFAQRRILGRQIASDEATEDRQKEFVKTLKDRRPEAVEAARAANDLVKTLESELKATTERIKKLKADVSEHDQVLGIESAARKAVAGIDQQTRGFSAGAGGAAFDAAARIQGGGGSATDFQLVEPVMKSLGANSQNGSKVLQMLAAQAGINDAHGATLDAIKARLDAQAVKAANRTLPGAQP